MESPIAARPLACRLAVPLLDLGLPRMSGIDVTREVKKTQPKVEILIFTIFDEEDKVLQRSAFKGELERLRAVLDVPHDVAFPPGLGRVELVKDLDLGTFAERFKKRASFVDFPGADDHFDIGREMGGEDINEGLESGERRFGFSGLIVGEKVRSLEPDDLFPSEKRHRLDRLDHVPLVTGFAVCPGDVRIIG